MKNIPRLLERKIIRSLKPQKAALIFGARRTGKTVLMKLIIKQWKGKVLSLNGEDYDTQSLLENCSVANYRRLLNGIRLLAIDEAQNIPDIGSKIKLILDEIPSVCVLASGSSSFDLQNQTGEPLVGRSKTFKLAPFSQKEISAMETVFETQQNLEERLIYGSYPEVVTMKRLSDKADYLREITQSYLLKDILAIDGLKKYPQHLQTLTSKRSLTKSIKKTIWIYVPSTAIIALPTTAALLVLFSGTAGARVVAAYCLFFAHRFRLNHLPLG